MNAQRGFTLIEILVVVAIVAILAAIAIPSFRAQALKARRADAVDLLAELQLEEARYRADNPTYAGTALLLGIGNRLTTHAAAAHYTITIAGASATGVTLTATARTGQDQDRNPEGGYCTPLVLTINGGSVSKSPAGCW
ncbi:MAG: type IV pilin protein [Xanthomonadales bacterium]|nr:type IV pilin protein [Xanthomonadales bacterium]